MSASPPTPIQSAKRPLEDPSSPSGPTDQPDAKRPALDKVTKEEIDETAGQKVLGDEPADAKVEGGDSTNGVQTESKDRKSVV